MTNAEKIEIVSLVEDHRIRARDVEAEIKESFHVYEAIWFLKYLREQISDTTKQSPKTKSAQFVGYGHSQMETAVSRFMSIFFRRDMPFEVDPLGGASIEDAQAVAALHMSTLRITNFRRMFRQALRFLMMYGTVPLKTIWTERWGKKGELVPVRREDGTWDYEERDKDVLLYAGPETLVVDPYLFHVEPGADCIENAQWVQEEFIRDKQYIQDLIDREVYEPVKWDEIAPYSSGADSQTDYVRRRKELMGAPDAENQDYLGDKLTQARYRVVEEWHDDMVYTVLSGGENSALLRARPNPYLHRQKPYRALRYLDLANEFWAVSMARQVEGPQSELNLIRRLRSDSLLGHLQNMWRIDPSATLALEEDVLEFRPNGLVEAGKDELEPLKRDPLPIFGYKEEEILRQDGDMITGVTDIFRGQGAASQTATGGTLNANFSTDRLALFIDGVADEMGGVFQQRHALIQQYGDQGYVVRAIGEKGLRPIFVEPQQIAYNYDFVFRTGRELVQKELYRNQLLQGITVASQNPMLAQITNFPELMRTYWAMMDIPNTGDFVIDPMKAGLTQQAEIMVMAMGEPVSVRPTDNHIEHVTVLQELMQSPEFGQIPQQGQALIAEHLKEHMPYYQQLVAIQGQAKGLSAPERAHTATTETQGEVLSTANRELAPKVRTQ